MRRLDPCLAPAGYSPRRYETLSPAPVLDMGERMTDLRDIQALFANGEQGGYWPADPAYAYEDSAGTIPASVNGVVGLRFDVSRGLQNIENITNSNNEAALFSLGSSIAPFNISRSQQSSIPGSGYYAEYVSTSNSHTYHQHSLFDAIANKTYKFSLKFYVPTGGISTFCIYDNNDGSWFGIRSSVKDQWVNVSVIRPPKATNWAYTIGNNNTETISNGQIAFLLDDVSVIEIVGNHAIQATTANKPYLRKTPVSNKYWLDSNTETGALTATFSSSLGSACTIATVGAEGVTIAENQTVSTTYNIAQTFGYNGDVLIINRALTVVEKALVTRVLGRNVPTLGPELLPNADLSSGEGWFISSAISPSWVFSNGQAVLSPIASASGIQVNGVCKVNGQYLFSATVTAFSGGLWYYGALGYPPPQYNIGHCTKANVATSTDFRVFGSYNTSLMVDSVSAKEIL